MVSLVTSYGLGDLGLGPDMGKICFSSTKYPDWLWGPISLLYSGYEGILNQESSSRDMRLTTPLRLRLWLMISRAIPLFPYKPSCCVQ